MRVIAAWEGMPSLIRFLVTNAAFGAVIGVVVATAFLITNVANVGHLLVESDRRVLFGIICYTGAATSFAAVVTSTALMLMPLEDT